MKSTLKVVLLAGVCGAITTGAFAADLMAEPPMAPVVTSSAGNWDGGYVGFNVGYAQAYSDHNDVATTIGDMGMVGWLLGGQAGYNATVAAGLVLGVQGDLDWSNVTGTYTGPGPDISETINWEGSLTGHIGFDGGVFMPYALGGIVVAGTTRTSTIGTPSESGTHVGYVVGVGAAAKVSDNASLFGEVRYNNYGDHEYSTLTSDPTVGLTSTEVRVGMNFHF